MQQSLLFMIKILFSEIFVVLTDKKSLHFSKNVMIFYNQKLVSIGKITELYYIYG